MSFYWEENLSFWEEASNEYNNLTMQTDMIFTISTPLYNTLIAYTLTTEQKDGTLSDLNGGAIVRVLFPSNLLARLKKCHFQLFKSTNPARSI